MFLDEANLLEVDGDDNDEEEDGLVAADVFEFGFLAVDDDGDDDKS